MMGSDDARWQSVFPVRAVGYGLLVLAIFDIVNIFYPADFTNAQWEFGVFGELVERVPVPLIGLALVFLGRAYGRSIWEKRLVLLLSWMSLVFGLGFFILAPLGWNAFSRIENQVNSAAEQQTQQLANQVNRFSQQVEQAPLPGLEQLASRFNQQGRTIVGNGEEGIRKQLLAEIDSAGRQANRQTKRGVQAQILNLRKNFIKWAAGAFVSGILFVYIFATTGWSRRGLKRGR